MEDVTEDPSRYYVKDYPTYTAEYYPELNHDPSEVYSSFFLLIIEFPMLITMGTHPMLSNRQVICEV